MGAPNQEELSQTADYIINGNPDVPEPDDDDFVVVMNAAIEVLRGMKRHVSWPKIADELQPWLQLFINRGAVLPPNLMKTRGLFLWKSSGGGEPYYFLGEDLKIYTVFRAGHDGSGRHSDDAKDWRYYTPVLRTLTIEEFRDQLHQRYGDLLRVVTTMVSELREQQKSILERANYVGKRADTLEAMVSRTKKAGGL